MYTSCVFVVMYKNISGHKHIHIYCLPEEHRRDGNQLREPNHPEEDQEHGQISFDFLQFTTNEIRYDFQQHYYYF